MILAIDTSTQWMGIALLQEGEILYEKVWRSRRRHTVELAPAIQAAVQDCGMKMTDLSAIAVALGPGSFTSLRIGLAMAKGLALALRVPLVGIPSLEICAAGLPPQDKPLLAVLKAGRKRLAVQRFQTAEKRWQAQGEIFMANAMELLGEIQEPTLICGEISAEERKILERKWRNALVADPAENMRRPSRLALLAAARLEHAQPDDVVTLAPIYVHTLNTPAGV